MKDNYLAVKIFAVSVLLQELLDETSGKTQFKNKVRFHINGLQQQLNNLNTVTIETDEVSLLITNAVNALDQCLLKKDEG
jgi:hypothetical protein